MQISKFLIIDISSSYLLLANIYTGIGIIKLELELEPEPKPELS